MKAYIAAAAIFIVIAGTAELKAAPGLAARPDAPSRLAAVTPITPKGAWTVYHHDNAHTGFDSTQPSVVSASTGWVSPALDGQVYGEPLVYNGLVYVATLNNTIYALNQSDGSKVWSVNLGAPQTSGWACGNINPTGTLGTGVIDTTAQRIYIAPFLHQFLSYYLFGIDLATGSIKLQTAVKPTGFDWTIEQQRGALAISTDGTHVYVPFGGRAGDCGAYHGWVAGVPTDGTTTLEAYKTPSQGEGFWAAGGVVIDDSTGKVFVTSATRQVAAASPRRATQSSGSRRRWPRKTSFNRRTGMLTGALPMQTWAQPARCSSARRLPSSPASGEPDSWSIRPTSAECRESFSQPRSRPRMSRLTSASAPTVAPLSGPSPTPRRTSTLSARATAWWR